MTSNMVRNKIVLALSLLLLAAFILVSYFNYTVSKRAVREELLHSGLPLTRDTIYSELQKVLMRPFMVASSMANDSFLREWVVDGEGDVGRLRRYLTGMRDKYGFSSTFFVSENTKRYYYHGGVLKKVSRMALHDVWYYEFVARGVEYDLDVDTNEAEDNEVTLFINFRVEEEDGSLAGVTGVGLRLDMVAGLLQRFQSDYGRRVFLVDQFGIIQMHSDQSLVERGDIHKMPGISAVSSNVMSLHSQPRNFEYDTLSGGHVLLTARYIPELNWTLIVEQDEASALVSARGNFFRIVAAALVVWVVIVGVTLATLRRYQLELERAAMLDPLTRCGNRRAFDLRFEEAKARYERHREPFCLLLLDLDNFKQVNDMFGHRAGDKALVTIADKVRSVLRPDDYLARWGGDEFILLIGGKRDHAEAIAERVLAAVRGLEVDFGSGLVTVSCGVAEYKQGETLTVLVHRADGGVYDCKDRGGDAVCVV